MNFLDILAGVLASCISIVLWLALVNEVCKEMYPERSKPSVPSAALVTWVVRRREQQRDDAALRGPHHRKRSSV